MTSLNQSNLDKKTLTIAIDGPVASGKGTIAPLLAEKLNGFYLYTGGMYRALTLEMIENNIGLEDESQIKDLIHCLDIELKDSKVFLNGRDVTDRIRESDVVELVSKVSSIPFVREEMVKRQKEISDKHLQEGLSVVAEGRDTATILFPDADLKIFLDADIKTRAKRRLEQLEEAGYKDFTFDVVLEATIQRDKEDSEREKDPLVTQPEKHGYIVIDNSDLTEKETIDLIMEKIEEKL